MNVHLGGKKGSVEKEQILVSVKMRKICHLRSNASMAPAWPSAQIWEEET